MALAAGEVRSVGQLRDLAGGGGRLEYLMFWVVSEMTVYRNLRMDAAQKTG